MSQKDKVVKRDNKLLELTVSERMCLEAFASGVLVHAKIAGSSVVDMWVDYVGPSFEMGNFDIHFMLDPHLTITAYPVRIDSKTRERTTITNTWAELKCYS